jgi:hypothetical protein
MVALPGGGRDRPVGDARADDEAKPEPEAEAGAKGGGATLLAAAQRHRHRLLPLDHQVNGARRNRMTVTTRASDGVVEEIAHCQDVVLAMGDAPAPHSEGRGPQQPDPDGDRLVAIEGG